MNDGRVGISNQTWIRLGRVWILTVWGGEKPSLTRSVAVPNALKMKPNPTISLKYHYSLDCKLFLKNLQHRVLQTQFVLLNPNESSMSSQDQVLVSFLSHIALSFDGAVLGLSLAYVAVRTIQKFTLTSAALHKITHAPSVSVSDLRSLLEDTASEDNGSSGDGKIVIVRGTVDAKSAVDGSWKALWPGVLISRESGDRGVVLQRTQTVTVLWFCLFG